MRSIWSSMLGMTLISAASLAYAAGDAVRGKALYTSRCAACHAVDYNGTGPAHRDVFGRQAGLARGYAYSKALRTSGLIWTEQTLDAWLRDPEQLVPGQAMGVSVADPMERADLIAWLRVMSGK